MVIARIAKINNTSMKKMGLLIVSLLIPIIFSMPYFQNFKKTETKNSTSTIMVVSTIFPIYDFARQIGGDKVDVSLLLPPAAEAHSFEPTPNDIFKINEADLFIYIGDFMETWAKDIINSLPYDKINNKIIAAGSNITLIHSAEEHEHSDKNNIEHAHGQSDPHIWLDFDNAKIISQNIANALIQKDPANAKFYQENLRKYQEELSQLDQTYQTKLKNCQTRQIVYGGHYAFGYLAQRYELEYAAAQGFSPDSEPTADDLINLIKQVKQNKIEYIFYEELASPKIAETLAQETDTKILPLTSAHNITKSDYQRQISFITQMQTNLDNLIIGLDCHSN